MGTRDYNRRHYQTNKLYVGVDKDGKDIPKAVSAYTKREAMEELRRLGFRPVRVIQS